MRIEKIIILLIEQLIVGFPVVPSGQRQRTCPDCILHKAPCPQWLHWSLHRPPLQISPGPQSPSTLHESLLQPSSGVPTYPSGHWHDGLCLTTLHCDPCGQSNVPQGSEQTRSIQASEGSQSVLKPHVGRGEHPVKGRPVVPGGHMQVAAWFMTRQVAGGGQGLLEGRQGFTHWPL